MEGRDEDEGLIYFGVRHLTIVDDQEPHIFLMHVVYCFR